METNRELIKNWVRDQKKENPNIEADAIKELRVSYSTWRNILYANGYCPNPQTRLLLAQFTGIEEKKLFPTVGAESEAA